MLIQGKLKSDGDDDGRDSEHELVSVIQLISTLNISKSPALTHKRYLHVFNTLALLMFIYKFTCIVNNS